MLNIAAAHLMKLAVDHIDAYICSITLWFILTFNLHAVRGQSGEISGAGLRRVLEVILDGDSGAKSFQAYINKNTVTEMQVPNGTEIIQNLSDDLKSKLQERVRALKNIATFVEGSIAKTDSTENSKYDFCCEETLKADKYHTVYKKRVDFNKVCYTRTAVTPKLVQLLPLSLLSVFQTNYENTEGLFLQYYGSENGELYIYPSIYPFGVCGSYDPRQRPWYGSAANKRQKDVIILMDNSQNMAYGQFGEISVYNAAKEAVTRAIKGLNAKDRAVIIPFSKATLINSNTPKPNLCFLQELTPVSDRFVADVDYYLKIIKPDGPNQLSDELRKAFQILQNFSSSDRDTAVMLITAVPLADDTEDILSTVRELQTTTSKHVLLLYQLGENPVIHSMLKSIAAAYEGPAEINVLENQASLIKTAQIYQNFEFNFDSTYISPPYVDFATGLSVITLSRPVIVNAKLNGVVGISVTLSSLLSTLLNFKPGKDSYIFAFDRVDNNTIYHPLVPVLSNQKTPPTVLAINIFENVTFLQSLISGETSSRFEEKSVRYISKGDPYADGVFKETVPSNYYYASVDVETLHWELCVVLAVGETTRLDKLKDSVKQKTELSFLYHRFDLQPDNQYLPCRTFYRKALMGVSSVKFSPKSFKYPEAYYKYEENAETEKIFLKDLTSNNSSKIFAKGVVEDVYITSFLNDLWATGPLQVSTVTHAVWRYIATDTGVFRMLPTTMIPKVFDPTSRAWYKSTISKKGLRVASRPHLDNSGAGYIITVAQAITKKNSDEIFGVIALDLPLRYLQLQIQTKFFEDCTKPTESCFLMDEAGFIITHKDWIFTDETNPIPVDDVHITSKEQEIAKDMLVQGSLVRTSCTNLFQVREQFFYDIYLPKPVTRTISPELHYKAVNAFGTNVYIVQVINRTINTAAKKKNPCRCAGSVCRLPIAECECPCYAAPNFNPCSSQPTSTTFKPCTPIISTTSSVIDNINYGYLNNIKGLDFCIPRLCSAQAREGACHGIAHCRWCTHDSRGHLLTKAYCGEYNTCWFGQVDHFSLYPDFEKLTSSSNFLSFIVLGIAASLVGIVFVICVMRVARIACFKRKRAVTTQAIYEDIAFMFRSVVTDRGKQKARSLANRGSVGSTSSSDSEDEGFRNRRHTRHSTHAICMDDFTSGRYRLRSGTVDMEERVLSSNSHHSLSHLYDRAHSGHHRRKSSLLSHSLHNETGRRDTSHYHNVKGAAGERRRSSHMRQSSSTNSMHSSVTSKKSNRDGQKSGSVDVTNGEYPQEPTVNPQDLRIPSTLYAASYRLSLLNGESQRPSIFSGDSRIGSTADPGTPFEENSTAQSSHYEMQKLASDVNLIDDASIITKPSKQHLRISFANPEEDLRHSPDEYDAKIETLQSNPREHSQRQNMTQADIRRYSRKLTLTEIRKFSRKHTLEETQQALLAHSRMISKRATLTESKFILLDLKKEVDQIPLPGSDKTPQKDMFQFLSYPFNKEDEQEAEHVFSFPKAQDETNSITTTL